MRVLVTGGAGFIGSAVCRRLVADSGATVLNIDKLTYAGNPDNLRTVAEAPGYLFRQVDICDREAVRVAFAEFRPEGVIHLAAESHVDRSITGARAFLDTNVAGTFTLLEAARDYWSGLDAAGRDRFRFLHVSTDEVYGSLGAEGCFSEDSRYDPSSPYAATKAASDHLARAWQRTYGLPVVVSNCSNNYGPFQFPEKLIPLAILNAAHGLPVAVYGRGENIRDWLHVEDHARALETILRRGRPGETYAIGAGAERRNIDVVRRICAVLDTLRPAGEPHDRLIDFVADRPGHDFRYAMDAGRLETELGWRAEVPFDTGIERTARWYLDNDRWWRPLRDRVYGGERLALDDGRREP
jgi:dTDP-glucose 4,6-dehydratase